MKDEKLKKRREYKGCEKCFSSSKFKDQIGHSSCLSPDVAPPSGYQYFRPGKKHTS
jgi:hypothetical protein